MITREILQAVAAALPEKNATALRQAFPGVMFTECGEDDVPARLKPALETPGHFLFLFTNANGHCLEFTSDFDAATGIVVAARAENDA
ncbi:MAG: DUF6129 family protein [Candidatus Accumulibacter sp.]|jgi:hypothetical protein|nr:DUF6129 family protein [Accumulibacter sp.]